MNKKQHKNMPCVIDYEQIIIRCCGPWPTEQKIPPEGGTPNAVL